MNEPAEKNAEKKAKRSKVPQGRIGNRPYWVLLLSILVRTVHQLGAAVFLVFCLFGDVVSVPGMYLWLAVVSGVILVFTEWLRHRELYREFAGMATLIKCLLLGAAIHAYLPTGPAVLAAFVLASIGAHAPKEIRHRLLW
ncbi:MULTISPECIES: hypothetical protein [Desulfosediminicola]|uniref:hypothetical protein n=1 Tax=Desulfosediminicola TaxID=2886823 RepID=UPI0010ABEE11|nr:hypothetical protein [Desulfosediminicola ganghwensis]